MNSNYRPWLFSRKMDIVLLFAPIWILWLFFFIYSVQLEQMDMPLWMWAVFILGFDVSHVWSSIFRSYADKEEFQAHKKLFIITPIFVFVLSILILSFSIEWFWRIMAYLAVFHFIKQQYGFLALYKLRAGEKRKVIFSDKWVIYLATLYPIVYWHFNSASSFNWFAENDFVFLHTYIGNKETVQYFFQVANVLYWLVILFWFYQEISAKIKGEIVSIGKILWVFTTCLNWYFGIVFFNSDIIFSVSNVLAHGLPYFALIYFYRLRKVEFQERRPSPLSFRGKWVLILLGITLLAAFLEEYFWDMLVNRNKGSFFETVYPYYFNQANQTWTLVIFTAILAMPQQVHYIIDGYIWKMNPKNKFLKPIFHPNHES